MSPTRNSPSYSQESDSDSESSLSDVEDAIKSSSMEGKYLLLNKIHAHRMKRERRLKEHYATIKKMQSKMRRTENELESLKKENEKLKERMKMILSHFDCFFI